MYMPRPLPAPLSPYLSHSDTDNKQKSLITGAWSIQSIPAHWLRDICILQEQWTDTSTQAGNSLWHASGRGSRHTAVTAGTMRGGLVLFLCGLVLVRAAVILNDCQIIDTLNGKLLYDNRVTYMYEYFPTDYKLQVRYEEVLRCQNITALSNKGIPVEELRYLWGFINYSVLSKMQAVLPPRHPSRSYVTELRTLLHQLQKEQEVESDVIQEILDRLDATEAALKAVSPKALLDNCFRVLYALYEDECRLCNPSVVLAI